MKSNNKPGARSSETNIREMLESNAKLAIGKGLLVIPTQPIQVIMRRQQKAISDRKKPHMLSMSSAAKIIFQEGRVAALYRGTPEAFGKEVYKCGFYKGACVVKAPGIAEDLLNPLSNITSPTQYHFIKSTGAGCVAAAFDVVLGGFIEGAATHRAASNGEEAKKSFWTEVAEMGSPLEKFKSAYRGSIPAFAKGTFAFTTYFLAKDPIEGQVNKMYGVKYRGDLPWHGQLLIAVAVGVSVAGGSGPLDLVKTAYQMPNPNNLPIGKALYNTYQKFGIKGLGTGLPAKSLLIIGGWATTFIATSPTKQSKRETEEHKATGPRFGKSC